MVAAPAPGTIERLRVDGACIFYGQGRFEDERGFFEEFDFEDANIQTPPRQAGFSFSRVNALRGFHASPYGKVCMCMSGEFFEAIVDLRPWSPSFMQWDTVHLCPEVKCRLYIPPWVGHAVLARKEMSVLLYLKMDKFKPDEDIVVNAFDPKLSVPWPRPVGELGRFVMSEKDQNAPSAEEAVKIHAARLKAAAPAATTPEAREPFSRGHDSEHALSALFEAAAQAQASGRSKL